MKAYTLLIGSLILFSGCFFNDSIDGNGNVTTKTYNFSNFNQLKISDDLEVEILQGDNYEVIVRIDENLQKFIDVDQDNKTLRIETDRPVNLDPTDDIQVRVVMPEIRRIDASGASDVKMTTAFRQNEPLNIYLSGASKGKIYAILPEISLHLSGASHLTLEGNARKSGISLSGASKLDAEEFEFEDVDVGVSGASHAKISVKEKLEAHASGAGSVKYHKIGEVKVKANSSGAGSVQEIN